MFWNSSKKVIGENKMWDKKMVVWFFMGITKCTIHNGFVKEEESKLYVLCGKRNVVDKENTCSMII
jgi:hypothetical protein